MKPGQTRQLENFNEALQNSQAKPGEERCALRQKSLAQASTTSNLTQQQQRTQKSRTGMSVTATNFSSKHQSQSGATIGGMRGPGKPAFNKSDMSKMSALVARSDKEGGRMSPLREKHHTR